MKNGNLVFQKWLLLIFGIQSNMAVWLEENCFCVSERRSSWIQLAKLFL